MLSLGGAHESIAGMGKTAIALDQRGRQNAVRVAGKLVLNLVQQTVHCHGGQQLLGLFDGGQVDAGKAAVADVVEAKQGEIFRNANACLLGGLHYS